MAGCACLQTVNTSHQPCAFRQLRDHPLSHAHCPPHSPCARINVGAATLAVTGACARQPLTCAHAQHLGGSLPRRT